LVVLRWKQICALLIESVLWKWERQKEKKERKEKKHERHRTNERKNERTRLKDRATENLALVKQILLYIEAFAYQSF
jgi:hypothetical protein